MCSQIKELNSSKSLLSYRVTGCTTVRNVLPPVVQRVVSVGAGPGILAQHLTYHIAVGTRPLMQ